VLQKRQGFNLMAFLKTPYGMMAGFMVFSMFIMPKLKVGWWVGSSGAGGNAGAKSAWGLFRLKVRAGLAFFHVHHAQAQGGLGAEQGSKQRGSAGMRAA